MAVLTLSGIPKSFRAGDTVRFRQSDSHYPSSAWTMKISMRGPSVLTVAAIADTDPDYEDGYLVTITAAQTRSLLPGRYVAAFSYAEIATGEIESSWEYSFSVLPNLGDTTTGPKRAAYEAALAQMQVIAAGGIASFSINGQNIQYSSISELQKYLDRLHVEALAEDRARGISQGGGMVKIITRM